MSPAWLGNVTRFDTLFLFSHWSFPLTFFSFFFFSFLPIQTNSYILYLITIVANWLKAFSINDKLMTQSCALKCSSLSYKIISWILRHYHTELLFAFWFILLLILIITGAFSIFHSWGKKVCACNAFILRCVEFLLVWIAGNYPLLRPEW